MSNVESFEIRHELTKLPLAALFDLDGTLVDSAPDLAYALDLTLQELGYPPCGEEKTRIYVGNGFETLLQRALLDSMHTGDHKVAPDLLERARKLFSDFYAQHLCERTRIFPCVTECLQQLKTQGIKLACVTNKHVNFALELLEKIKLRDYFDEVVGAGVTEKIKPDPMPLLYIMERLGLQPEDGIMIGDSINDIQAGRAAGMPVAGLTYGYNQGHPMAELDPDILLNSLEPLPAILASIHA